MNNSSEYVCLSVCYLAVLKSQWRPELRLLEFRLSSENLFSGDLRLYPLCLDKV